MRYKKLLLVLIAVISMLSLSACSLPDITTIFDKKDTTYTYILPESLITNYGYKPEEFVSFVEESKTKAQSVSYDKNNNSVVLTLNKSQRKVWLDRTENELDSIMDKMQKADESFGLSFSSDFQELDMYYIDKSSLHDFKVTSDEYEAVQDIENSLTEQAVFNCGFRQILKGAETWSVNLSVYNSETKALVSKTLLPDEIRMPITDKMWQKSLNEETEDK